jgi:hypothetical protein
VSADYTIDGMIAAGTQLYACCDRSGCSNFVRMDLDALKAKLGGAHSIMSADLTPKLRCSKCGSRKVSIRLIPDYKRTDAWRMQR